MKRSPARRRRPPTRATPGTIEKGRHRVNRRPAALSAGFDANSDDSRKGCAAFRRGSIGEAPVPPPSRDFAKLIWQLVSPKWNFDAATFERSATAFDNLDHVDIVIHNYRWRLGLATGEPHYDEVEKRLAEAPVIGVPTITLEGDANSAPHPEPSAYAKMFSGRYQRRTVTGGIGHNLPQEAPEAFAQAVIDVGDL